MNDFPYYVTKFFADYLPLQIGASKNTIMSYRDTFIIFFDYFHKEEKIVPENFTFEQFTAENIENFLLYLEEKRGNGIQTRNQRLAALHSFSKFLRRNELGLLSQLNEVLAIPMKKAKKPMINYLTIEEIKILLSLPNSQIKSGLRDLAILSFMYDTGARVQEVIDCCTIQLFLQEPPFVDLKGKGNKVRRVPFSQDVCGILKSYMNQFEISENSDVHLFMNKNQKPLTRAGIQYILEKYVDLGRQKHPDLFRKKITNHCLRHSKSMHLLEAGVNLVYIRDLLGHSSVATTERYARANPEMKRKILEKNSLNVDNRYSKEEKSDLMNWLKNNL